MAAGSVFDVRLFPCLWIIVHFAAANGEITEKLSFSSIAFKRKCNFKRIMLMKRSALIIILIRN